MKDDEETSPSKTRVLISGGRNGHGFLSDDESLEKGSSYATPPWKLSRKPMTHFPSAGKQAFH